MNKYGCELRSLSNDQINDLLVSCTTHCYLLPMLSQCLSLVDETCSRSLNCISAHVRSNSYLVRSVALYSIQRSRYVVRSCAHRTVLIA
jgi:hypothetical protein